MHQQLLPPSAIRPFTAGSGRLPFGSRIAKDLSSSCGISSHATRPAGSPCTMGTGQRFRSPHMIIPGQPPQARPSSNALYMLPSCFGRLPDLPPSHFLQRTSPWKHAKAAALEIKPVPGCRIAWYADEPTQARLQRQPKHWSVSINEAGRAFWTRSENQSKRLAEKISKADRAAAKEARGNREQHGWFDCSGYGTCDGVATATRQIWVTDSSKPAFHRSSPQEFMESTMRSASQSMLAGFHGGGTGPLDNSPAVYQCVTSVSPMRGSCTQPGEARPNVNWLRPASAVAASTASSRAHKAGRAGCDTPAPPSRPAPLLALQDVPGVTPTPDTYWQSASDDAAPAQLSDTLMRTGRQRSELGRTGPAAHDDRPTVLAAVADGSLRPVSPVSPLAHRQKLERHFTAETQFPLVALLSPTAVQDSLRQKDAAAAREVATELLREASQGQHVVAAADCIVSDQGIVYAADVRSKYWTTSQKAATRPNTAAAGPYQGFTRKEVLRSGTVSVQPKARNNVASNLFPYNNAHERKLAASASW